MCGEKVVPLAITFVESKIKSNHLIGEELIPTITTGKIEKDSLSRYDKL